MEKGAQIETRDKKDGITPLIATFFDDHRETCRYLLEAGASIMSRRTGDTGITPLVNSIALQRTEIGNIICEHGACCGRSSAVDSTDTGSRLVFNNAVKSGFLKKKGGGHRSSAFKKRWFTLYGVYFLYFKQQKVRAVPSFEF